MSAWLRQAVGLLIVAVLAGSPAAAAVCEIACAGPDGRAHSHEHATAQHAHPSASMPAVQSHGAHHAHAAAMTDGRSTMPPADVTPSAGHACCERAGVPTVSRTAGREDSHLTPAPPVALVTASGLAHPPLTADAPLHRGPPAVGQPSTTPRPLRI